MTTIHEANHRSVDETIELTAVRPVVRDEGDPRPPAPSREPSRILARLGWLFAALAVAGAVTLAVVAFREPTTAQRPITDAKDHPGYGPIPLGPVVQRPITDAKDHPGYGPIPLGPVVQRPITDAKDHPGYGPIPLGPVVQRPITDAKDHPGYGPIPLGPVVQRPITDAKDHPGYGPIPLGPVVQRPITDAKDHPGYGPAATTCPALPGTNGIDCPAG